MKYLIGLGMYFILFTASCQENKPEKLSLVKIDYVDRYISIIVGVNCNDFERVFSGTMRSKEIKNEDSLSFFTSTLSNVQLADSSYNIDVRAKINFYFSTNKRDSMCIDGAGNIMLNGKNLKRNLKIYSGFLKYIGWR